MEKKVLFILKRKEGTNIKQPLGIQTGLYNSASYVNNMLNTLGIISNMVIVTDNNDIDREVTKYRPTHVIIEALWVVPTKFSVLCKIHPNVKWIVRLHSEMPFLANEGIAMDWIAEYSGFKNVTISANSYRLLDEIRMYIKIRNNYTIEVEDKVIHLPNFYPQEYTQKDMVDDEYINISCFGAIRPLKNHLIQAFAAVRFSKAINKKLRFHINSTRIEMKGEPILHNLKAMFIQLDMELVMHEWMERDMFLEVCSDIDIGMQCSFSETFNIVAADMISRGIPVVGSSEIPWMVKDFCCDPVNSDDIYDALIKTHTSPNENVLRNQESLTNYTNNTLSIWSKYFKNNQ